MSPKRWIARLPKDARPPFRVWVNGVEQHEGTDYTVSADALVFDRPLAKEGKLGFWRWALMIFGIAGTYRRNDSVDVQYQLAGRTKLASGLDVEPEVPVDRERAAEL